MLTVAAVFKDGRTVPSTEVTEVMAELLNLQPGEKLMEIGTGSGFQTEFWACAGAEVHTIECKPVIDPERKGPEQCYAHLGDGKRGIPQEAPFDAIVVTCGVKGGPEKIPGAWVAQLREGGRIVVPLGNVMNQRLVLLRKVGGQLDPVKTAAYVRFSMLE